MKDKRLTEVLELLLPAWREVPDLNLLQFYNSLPANQDTGEIFRHCLMMSLSTI